MAFFKRNEQGSDPDDTQTWPVRDVSRAGWSQQAAAPGPYERGKDRSQPEPDEDDYEDDYDDGLDDPIGEEEDEELTEEELAERKQGRVHLFFGAGNMLSIIAGSVLILLLITLILSMVNFVMTDMNRNFVLFRTNF